MPTLRAPISPGRSSRASGDATASAGSTRRCTSIRRSSTTDRDVPLTETTRRRRLAALATLLVFASAFGAGAREPQLYVSNELPNTISVISPRTNAVVATIPVGNRPRGMALSPDKRTVYVVLAQGDVHGPLVGAQRHATRAIAHRDGRDHGVGARGDDGDGIGEFVADVELRLTRACAEGAREHEECGQGGEAPPASGLGQWNVPVSR